MMLTRARRRPEHVSHDDSSQSGCRFFMKTVHAVQKFLGTTALKKSMFR